ncbi:DUF2804 domain-containing protein [Crenobacter cavernae]|uniref:DUF2804 domain-containing protein n=1 Tax=Crenobacter cavernae TaxID=2290923 RepID=A0A345Y599_9NEIS|nr:DUF2804 domain-containing protein [Crenobacter cavernae]AXK39101.1 DUF2804 domain-containing protein [Crenobacter cavernae]
MDPSPSSLPPAPAFLVHERGVPAFGMYQGVVGSLSWSPLKAPPFKRLTRRLHHKRWQYVAFAHEHFFVAAAVVDVGWTGAAFAYVFDRGERRIVAEFSATGLPGRRSRIEDRAFGDATFRAGKRCVAFRRADSRLEVTVNAPELKLAAHVDLSEPGPILAAIAPANWLAHATHKSGALPAAGFVDVAGAHLSLDGAVASLDASNGLLARDTRWRWASAHTPGLGFNLQAGFMGSAENALWLDGELFRLAEASFDFDEAAPLAPWRIRTADGLVDLEFRPEGARSDYRRHVIAESRYLQPIGTFHGTVTHPVSGEVRRVANLVGVTEDHASKW